MTELVRSDLGNGAAVPSRTVLKPVVEHELADDDLVERNPVDGARVGRAAVSTDREDAAATRRIGDLAIRIVEDDTIGSAAAGVG